MVCNLDVQHCNISLWTVAGVCEPDATERFLPVKLKS